MELIGRNILKYRAAKCMISFGLQESIIFSNFAIMMNGILIVACHLNAFVKRMITL